MHVAHLLTGHGAWPYLVTFAWTFVEGESFVLFAGFAAAQGLLSLPLLLLVAWLGSFAGDQTYFWIGRRFGLALLSRRPSWRQRVDKVMAFVRRYDTWFILSFRFIYGVRNFSSFAIGISGVGWLRFLVLNLIAALVWAIVFVGAGYLSGRAAHRMLGHYAERFSLVMLGGFAAILIGVYLYQRIRRRRADAKAARLPAANRSGLDAR
jgi:membrane protein DedA with SNARE-associated domain